MVFIDACHDYEAVRDDIQLWKDLILPAGYLVLHDFSDAFPGAAAAVRESVLMSSQFSCILLLDALLVARRLAA
jgi:hypothetical protein